MEFGGPTCIDSAKDRVELLPRQAASVGNAGMGAIRRLRCTALLIPRLRLPHIRPVPRRRVLVLIGEAIGVHVQGHLGAGVAKALAHHMDRHPGAQEQGTVGMAQVVRPGARQPGRREQRVKVPLLDVAVIHGAAQWPGEDQLMFLIRGARGKGWKWLRPPAAEVVSRVFSSRRNLPPASQQGLLAPPGLGMTGALAPAAEPRVYSRARGAGPASLLARSRRSSRPSAGGKGLLAPPGLGMTGALAPAAEPRVYSRARGGGVGAGAHQQGSLGPRAPSG